MEAWADEFVTSAGRLVQTLGRRDPSGGYAELDFVFTDRSLRLSCDVDTDEIVVEPHETATPGLDDLSADGLLGEGIGKVIEDAWWMSNHRGYQDAFQMRLLDLDDRSEATLQFEAAASVLWVRTVTG